MKLPSSVPNTLAHWPTLLGAVELLQAVPDHAGARRLVSDAADSLPAPATSDTWPWPELRLSYANALVPEAALAAATAMGRKGAAADALQLLEWLVDEEMLERSLQLHAGRWP